MAGDTLELEPLLVEFIQLERVDQMESMLRKHPELLTEACGRTFTALIERWVADGHGALAASANVHRRVLQRYRATRDDAQRLAAAAWRLNRAFTGTDDLEALQQAVNGWRSVLAHPGFGLLPAGVRAGFLIDAGNDFLRHSEQRRGLDELEAAIACYRQASRSDPTGPRRVAATINLAAALRQRGHADDLEAAVELLTAGTSAEDPATRALAWSNLGHVRMDQYLASADAGLLAAAGSAYRRALTDTESGSTAEPGRLSHLAVVSVERWRHSGDQDALRTAVQQLERAITAARLHPGRRGVPLNNLASVLLEFFECSGDLTSLERAIDLFGQAARDDVAGSAGQMTSLANLGAALARRYEYTGDTDDISRSAEAFGTAHQAGNLPPEIASLLSKVLSAAMTWLVMQMTWQAQWSRRPGRWNRRTRFACPPCSTIWEPPCPAVTTHPVR